MPCDDFRLDLAAEFGIIHESASGHRRQLHKGSPLATRHSNLPIENLEIHYMYAYFIAIVGFHALQSIVTVDLEKSRVKTPLLGAVSWHRPDGSP